MNLTNPNDPVTITNLPTTMPTATLCRTASAASAGFGVATGYQAPRTIQFQVRFSF